MNYTVRDATGADYQFLFELKKAAEYDAIAAVFGWDEDKQSDLHAAEWTEAKPKVVEVDGAPVGSYLFLEKEDHFYLGRYFLLPEHQGKGIGSEILRRCILEADSKRLPVRLCYLQGNRVGRLYLRYGFQVTEEDRQFVYMEKMPAEHIC